MTEIDPKALKSARSRLLSGARRSLKLVTEAAAQHTAALAEGTAPEDGFLASALKYEQARASLGLLDSLAAGEEGQGEVLVQASDVALLVQVLAEFGVAGGAQPGDGTPLGNLAAAAGMTAIAAPAAQPAPQGQQVPA